MQGYYCDSLIALNEVCERPLRTLNCAQGSDGSERTGFGVGVLMAGGPEHYDFVIVGSGAGSMSAALVMRAAGRSVVVLEKTDLIGGSTARSGGVMWIPNNRFMKAAGVEDGVDQALTYLNAVVGDDSDAPGTSLERRRTYVTQASRAIDFLDEQGVRLGRVNSWPDYYDELPGGSQAGRTVVADLFNVRELGEWSRRLRPSFFGLQASLQEALELPLITRSWSARRTLARVMGRTLAAKLTGKHWVSAGAALQGRLLQAALKAGVEFRTEVAVRELIVEEGRVVGVLALEKGAEAELRAGRGVLLNAGGFARNQAMLDQYCPGVSTEWTNACPGDTGEMIEEGRRIGAALGQMNERIGTQMAMPPGHGEVKPMIQTDVTKPHAILVDQSGARYMNEAGSYMAFCKGMLARHETTPAIPSWMVMDSRYLRTYMLADSMPGVKKPKAWEAEGFLKKGATLEALALACGMKPDVLEATVQRFNGFAQAGRDLDFGRGDRAYDLWLGDPLTSQTLGAIETGPFYAVPIVPGDVGTFGGLVTDVDARVLRDDGSVIEGLYATGNCTASVMGRGYPGAGASIGPSLTWGYVAALHAAGRPEPVQH